MLCKHGEFENGYIFTKTTTNDDIHTLYREYEEKGDPIRCVICNENTLRNFVEGKFGTYGLTKNNKIADGCFFVNRIC